MHSKEGHGFTPVHPCLQIESISSSCTYDSKKDLSFDSHKNNDQPYGPHDTKFDITFFPHSSVISNIQNWYRPLHLPHFLHDFPTNIYKYLPRFDGEYDNFTVEKHLHDFEHFFDLF